MRVNTPLRLFYSRPVRLEKVAAPNEHNLPAYYVVQRVDVLIVANAVLSECERASYGSVLSKSISLRAGAAFVVELITSPLIH